MFMPSTSIRRSEYDPDTRTLWVWFVASGKRYDFEGVPSEIYAAFSETRSRKVASSTTTSAITSAIIWSRTNSQDLSPTLRHGEIAFVLDMNWPGAIFPLPINGASDT